MLKHSMCGEVTIYVTEQQNNAGEFLNILYIYKSQTAHDLQFWNNKVYLYSTF